jgi:[protein-PII] uridylyltransferase
VSASLAPDSAPLHAAPDTAAMRAGLKAAKGQLIEAFEAKGHLDSLTHGLARQVDRTLASAWHGCELPDTAALVAVGGYGRGELAPFSDVDILVLLQEPPDSDDELRIERFIGMAWDLGLDIGSSVRTVEQCLDEAGNDVTVRTSLLESRLVAGDAALYERFALRFHEALDPRAFFTAKLLEMRQRHAKYQDSPYSLEPNCKESPGGLRDLQLIIWITRAAATRLS